MKLYELLDLFRGTNVLLSGRNTSDASFTILYVGYLRDVPRKYMFAPVKFFTFDNGYLSVTLNYYL